MKSDLGEKAVILSTKKVKDKSMLGMSKIEVTAALTPPVFDEAVLPRKTFDDKSAQQILQAVKKKRSDNHSATINEPCPRNFISRQAAVTSRSSKES